MLTEVPSFQETSPPQKIPDCVTDMCDSFLKTLLIETGLLVFPALGFQTPNLRLRNLIHILICWYNTIALGIISDKV